jgi:hypothetical protein
MPVREHQTPGAGWHMGLTASSTAFSSSAGAVALVLKQNSSIQRESMKPASIFFRHSTLIKNLSDRRWELDAVPHANIIKHGEMLTGREDLSADHHRAVSMGGATEKLAVPWFTGLIRARLGRAGSRTCVAWLTGADLATAGSVLDLN